MILHGHPKFPPPTVRILLQLSARRVPENTNGLPPGKHIFALLCRASGGLPRRSRRDPSIPPPGCGIGALSEITLLEHCRNAHAAAPIPLYVSGGSFRVCFAFAALCLTPTTWRVSLADTLVYEHTRCLGLWRWCSSLRARSAMSVKPFESSVQIQNFKNSIVRI